MINMRSFIVKLSRRFSTSSIRHGLENYKAASEPVAQYLPGSSERSELEKTLEEYDKKLHEVPIVIGDEELTTSDVHYQVRPYDHQNKLAQYYHADAKLMERAIDVSLKSHRAWEARSIEERSEIFLRAADLISGKYKMDIMAATMLGQGKTIIQAELDAIAELADFYRYDVENAMKLNKLQPHSPFPDQVQNTLFSRSTEGFWAAISPFNFTAIGGNLAGTPAYLGNVVLWKPSHAAILSSYIVFKVLREAGVPPGVINFLPSSGKVFGSAVTTSSHLAGLNFTGSVPTFEFLWKEVAKNLSAAQGFPRLIGECGGKFPLRSLERRH